MTSQFILGLIAGEGSFSFSTQTDKGRFGVYIQPSFSLSMYEEKLVREVHETLGLGHISERSDGMYALRITSRDERLELIKFVDRNASELFKASEKYIAYCNWKRMVERKQELMKTKDGMRKLVRMAHSVNDFGKSTNYSSEELLKIIDENDQHFCGVTTSKEQPCENPVNSEDAKCYLHQNH